jgi:spore coat polysaccharide biosynthesis predicted glycosyltransferase SpsG
VLDALATAGLAVGIHVVVILGAGAPELEAVVQQASRMPFRCEVRVDVRDMAEQMAEADLAIGAAGGSSWERCVLGLPSVMIVLADNQREIAAALDFAGAAVPLPGGDLQALGHTVRALLGDRERIYRISAAASMQCDGLGAGRVVNEMLAGLSP